MAYFRLFTQSSQIHTDSSLHPFLPVFPLAHCMEQLILPIGTCTKNPRILTPTHSAEQDKCPLLDGTLVSVSSPLCFSLGISLFGFSNTCLIVSTIISNSYNYIMNYIITLGLFCMQVSMCECVCVHFMLVHMYCELRMCLPVHRPGNKL